MRTFSEIKYIAKQRKWLYICPFIICPLFALITIIFAEPLYYSTAKLWTKEKQNESQLLKILRQGIQEETYIKVQLQIILSFQVVKRVVEKLNLTTPPPSQSLFHRLMKSKPKEPKIKNPHQALVDAVALYQKSITAEILNPEIIQLTVKTNDPLLSQKICVELIEQYKKSYLEILNVEVESAEYFLKNWLKELKEDLDKKTQVLIDFELEHPEIRRDLMTQPGESAGQPELSPTYAKTMPDASPIPLIMNRIGQLKLDLNKSKTFSTKNNYDIDKILKEIETDQVLLDDYSKYLSDQAILLIQRDYLYWLTTQAELRYTSIIDEYDKVYLSRGSKLQQTTSITVLDTPSYSLKPIFPRKKITLLISIFLGALISGSMLYLNLLFDKRIYFSRDLKELTQANVIALYKRKAPIPPPKT